MGRGPAAWASRGIWLAAATAAVLALTFGAAFASPHAAVSWSDGPLAWAGDARGSSLMRTMGVLASPGGSHAARVSSESNPFLWPAAGPYLPMAEDVTPPSVPGSVVATPGDGQVTLRWDASADDVGVVGYDVMYDVAADYSTASAETVLGTTVTITGLKNGTTYYFYVMAFDANGNGSDPVEFTAVPAGTGGADATPPSTVTGLVIDIEATPAELSWDAASDNVGVTGYDIQASSDEGFASPEAFTSSTTTLGVGVEAGTPKWFRVRATDAAGNAGAWSEPLAGERGTAGDTTPPSRVAGLVLAPGDGVVLVAWDGANDDVGVAGYDVSSAIESDFSDEQSFTSESTGGTLAELTNGTTYLVRVRAFDGSGNKGEWSDIASATPAAGENTGTVVPRRVTGLKVTPGAGSARLEWVASEDATTVGYEVSYSTSSTFSVDTTRQVSGTSTAVTGLKQATPYFFRVRALDASGNAGEWSVSATAMPTASGSGSGNATDTPTLPRTGIRSVLPWPAVGFVLVALVGMVAGFRGLRTSGRE